MAADDKYGLEPATDDDKYGLEPAGAGAATATAEPPTDEEIEASYGKDVTPRMREALKSGVAPMQRPTQFETDRPGAQGSVLGQGLGTLGRQIKGAAAASVAPWTKGYETYQDVRAQGGGVLPAIGAGVARGVANTYGADPFEEVQSDINIPKEYQERREAGYGPVYSALAPPAAKMTQIDLPTMEAAARAGNVPGVIAEAAVPAAEIAAGEAAKIPAVKSALRAPIDIATGTPLTEAGRLEAARQQALAVKPPKMSETEYAQRVTNALPDLQRVAQDNVGKIKTPRDAVEGINRRIGEMEAPIGDHLTNVPSEIIHPDQYVADMESSIDRALQNSPSKLTAKEIAGAKAKIDDLFAQEGAQPLSEMEKIRRRLNTDAEDYFRSRPADKRIMDASDATAIAQRAAADYLRERLYGTDTAPGWLERAGVTAVDAGGQRVPMAEFRRRVGNLIEVRNHFEDAITKAETTGNWNAFSKWRSGPSLAAGGLGMLGGMAMGGPIGAVFGTLAGEGMKAWGDYLTSKNPNLNVQKMFGNLERTGRPNTVDINTRAPILQHPGGVGPVLPQHLEAIGPQPEAPPFQLNQQARPNPNESSLWQQQVGELPPVGFEPIQPKHEPITPNMPWKLGNIGATELPPGERTLPPPKPQLPLPGAAEIAHPEMIPQPPMTVEAAPHAPRRIPATGKMGKQLFKGEGLGQIIGQTAEGGPIREPAPKGLGEIGGAGREGVLGKINTTPGEKLEVGDTFVDERGDPRRVTEIAEDGTIKTADHTLRDYPQGEIRHLGEINSPKAQLARGGMFHEAGEVPEEIPYTRPMKIAPSMVRPDVGFGDPAVHHHELGHAVVAALNDFDVGAIVSHRDIGAGHRGASAALLFDMKGFANADALTRKVLGLFKRDIEPARADRLTDLFAAGAAANELIDGLHRDNNPALGGDRYMANEMFRAMGFEPSKYNELWNAAVDRAKEKLTPEIQAIIKDEATRREDNLPVQFHYSENRVKNIIKRVRGGYGTGEETSNAPGTTGEGNRIGEENVAGREGAGAEEPRGITAPEKLKPFKPPQVDYHFRVRPEGEENWKSVNLGAIDNKAAWKKLRKIEPNAAEMELIGENKPEIGPPAQLDREESTAEQYKNTRVNDAIDEIKERAKDQTHNGDERDYKVYAKGELDPNKIHGTTFMLDDGSALYADKGMLSHMQLAREIGQDNLNKANAIRVVTPDAFELHGMPSDDQLAEMNRLKRGLERKNVQNVHDATYIYWDFYPEDVKGYSADALSDRHESGAGSPADFRRAIDEYYKPATVEPDRVVNGKGVFDKPIEEGKLDAGRAKMPPEEEATAEEKNKFGPDDIRISTRTPTAKGATENPHTTPLSVNLDAVHATEGLSEKLADVVKKYPDLKKALAGVKDPNVALERFVQHISDNLEWLHNQMPPEVREITRKWYDSANTMAKDMADRHGYAEKQMAGVIASLSPQKDWNMNVSLADRVADTVKNKSDVPFSDEMLKKAKALTAEGANASMKSLLKNIKGKTLGEISDPLERAAWIRLYDEAHNSRSYNNIAPNGKVLGKATNVNGAESKVAWGSLNEIAKAANILEDGSRENISKQLGEMHKVRNFYNNIADPGSEHPDVTVDTHAVAAGHIQPFSGNSHEVGQNFGGPGSAITGVNGTYPLYAEAYRRAAEKLGIKPRELQSIVWEQVRDLFPAEWKTKENAKKVADIWGDYGKGKIKIGEARQKIVDLAGGFKKPEWLDALR